MKLFLFHHVCHSRDFLLESYSAYKGRAKTQNLISNTAEQPSINKVQCRSLA